MIMKPYLTALADEPALCNNRFQEGTVRGSLFTERSRGIREGKKEIEALSMSIAVL